MPQIRAIRTLAGNQIVFTEVPPSIAIQTPTLPGAIPAPPSPVGPHQSLMMSPAGIQITAPANITLQVGASSLMLTPAGVTLTAGSSSIAITPAGIVLQSGGASIALAAGNASVTAPMVRINS